MSQSVFRYVQSVFIEKGQHCANLLCAPHVIALTVEGIQGRKCVLFEDIIHRTMKASEARSIDSLLALRHLFVLNVMMSRCDDACLPGIEHCRATGYPVPECSCTTT